MDTQARRSDIQLPVTLMVIAGLGITVYLLLKRGFFSKLFGLAGNVADTANSALNTVRQVGRDLDPFNKKGKVASTLRAIDPAKGVKAVGRMLPAAISPITGGVGSVSHGVSRGIKSVKRRLRF